MDVVVVESPAKAKTINKYLGQNYRVIASYGHVRDLPAKDGSVQPDNDFAMDWEVDPKARKHIEEIASALKGADRLFLATDPDREGEAISWHVARVLESRKALKDVDIKRVVFNEITRDAILAAFARPRDLDQELVEAYLARRALDYLVGFTLSPVLWRKLPGSRSAGRVQSVALRLICERETEIEDFRPREYWTVKGVFRTPDQSQVTATLTHLDGKKLDKFDLPDEAAAKAAVAAVEQRTFAVAKVERKQTRRNPAPPFITSTLQQEASRKLGFSATRTMQLAQRLYEGISVGGETVGLITYMRTDGVQMAPDAIGACRALIERDFGASYLPKSARVYKSKVKNAQEAHEAIRPTDVGRRPADIAPFLDADQAKLYSLIWKRTVASQMESALIDQVAVDIASPDRQVVLRATGSSIAFDGFFKVYREGRDDIAERGAEKDEEGEGEMLPQLKVDEDLERVRVDAEQHFTQPPPRFTEASLVKRLEELGIGRPSTYASIISVLQDRKYVRLENKRFFPEDRGRLVTAFLTSFFERYVAYTFTAEMEARLDDISGGRIDWKSVLRNFWQDFSEAVEETRGLAIKDVLEALNERLGPHFFPDTAEGDPRACPACHEGRLSLKVGKFGAFIGCSNYPECRYTRPLVPMNRDEGEAVKAGESGPKLLGTDPESGLAVTLRKGPYGYYVQLGEAEGEGKRKTKPKRVSIERGSDPDEIDLDRALKLLSLPRTLGPHPETGETITAGIGRYGPFINMGDIWVSLKGDDDVLSIGLNRAVTLIGEAMGKKPPGRVLGQHPADGKPVALRHGRFGPYVAHGTTRATLPKGIEADGLTLDRAIEIVAAKEARAGNGSARGKTSASKKTASKTASAGETSPPAADPSKSARSTSKSATKGTTKSAGKATGKGKSSRTGSASGATGSSKSESRASARRATRR
ncbi:MAG: type I DNA topoisomerase [Rhodospirillales bacterium]|nr:MAG: type I DNA topoisomerase [Rhodospirillales bacterium]